MSALEKNTATAQFKEHLVSNGPPPISSVAYYKDGLAKIQSGGLGAKNLPIPFVRQVAQLNKNAGKTFAFGEVKFGATNVFRLDEAMRSQASQLLSELTQIEKGPQKFFKGYVATSFDGVLKSVDLRGDTKRAYLILTAGGHQIDCDITHVDLETLRNALDNRAIVTGLAYYPGDRGLPIRIEIRAIKVAKTDTLDLSRWRGAFKASDNDIEFEWSRD